MIDFNNPDYVSIFRRRLELLKKIRSEPALVPTLKLFYKNHPSQFISDWGVTVDPRNVERDLPALIPFILFKRQEEWVDWIVSHWRERRPGITEKSRDMGMSWLSVAVSCTLCLFHQGMAIGFGSRKEEYVDKIGSPKSLFYKARVFMQNLPVEFRGGWQLTRDAPHMRLNFPQTQSNMSGEAGDNIGRGDRAAIYFVDESAYLERPDLIEASLSQTTNCRQDISTPHGMGNPFAQRRHGGKVDVFTFHWRDDPRKDEKLLVYLVNGRMVNWYEKQLDELDPVTIAQEIDLDYSASVEGVMIPSAWVQSSIDAHTKLSLVPTGKSTGALDVADEGKDLNAFAGSHGFLLKSLDEWTGKGSDILSTVEKTFMLCDEHGYTSFKYDADGLGANVRGDARMINARRGRGHEISVEAFRGSGHVERPDAQDVKGRTNQDFFANAKAQAWWSLRFRFQRTHRWVTEGVACDPDDIISISSKLKLRDKLCLELSQPTYSVNAVGKIVVDKSPEGARSPNLADSVMMQFGSVHRRPRISSEALARA